MYQEGDLVKVVYLDEDIKEILADALESDFSEIEFYFVEHEDDDYVVLSAETETKFAIVHCPTEAIDGVYSDEKEIDDLLQHLLIEHSLKHRNKEMFLELTEPKEKPEKKAQNLYVDLVYEEGFDYFDDDYDEDDDFYS